MPAMKSSTLLLGVLVLAVVAVAGVAVAVLGPPDPVPTGAVPKKAPARRPVGTQRRHVRKAAPTRAERADPPTTIPTPDAGPKLDRRGPPGAEGEGPGDRGDRGDRKDPGTRGRPPDGDAPDAREPAAERRRPGAPSSGGTGGLVERLDRDGDGTISKAEFDGPDEHFDRLDANGDGRISADEDRQAQAGGGRTGGRRGRPGSDRSGGPGGGPRDGGPRR